MQISPAGDHQNCQICELTVPKILPKLGSSLRPPGKQSITHSNPCSTTPLSSIHSGLYCSIKMFDPVLICYLRDGEAPRKLLGTRKDQISC